MDLKKITLLAAVLILLSGFYFYESHWAEKQQNKSESSKKILDLNEERIKRIALKNAKGSLVLQKRKGSWFITEPLETQCDLWAVESIINSLTGERWEKNIKPLPKNLKDFGIDEPEITVSIYLEGESKPEKIYVGGETPRRTMRYIRVNQEKRLLLVRSRAVDALNKDVHDLRDKRIVQFEQEGEQG